MILQGDRFITYNWVALLENLMHHDERLEGLDFIGEDWLDAKS